MTLIECFTNSHIDNIAACLRLQPDKLVLVGDTKEMNIPAQRYRELLQRRGQKTQIALCDVGNKDLKEICSVLDKLVREEKNCVIDLTGGEEPVIMAVGAVLSGLDREQREAICVEKYDHAQKVFVDCLNDQRRIPGGDVRITVEEMLALHGGSLHPEAYQPPADCTRDDVAGLWKIVSDAPKKWNRSISLLNEFESRTDSETEIYLPVEQLRKSISGFDEKETQVRQFLETLDRRGIIDDRSSHYALEYTYRSDILRYCMQKAGNVLEVKTLLEGRGSEENGQLLFQDCRMSVNIDWDGVVHDPSQRVPETRNEIDVVLMHGMTPLFISCKNGNIGDEELYKLHTVATHFGGPHAKKMLVATDLDRKSASSNRAFTQRAWDMDIFLVTDAAELSDEEWQQAFWQALQ